MPVASFWRWIIGSALCAAASIVKRSPTRAVVSSNNCPWLAGVVESDCCMKNKALNAAILAVALCTDQALAGQLQTVIYDNFDDGNYDGWIVGGAYAMPYTAPDIVPSDQGFAIAGKAPTDSTWIYYPLSFTAVELSISFRAKSAPGWPNYSSVPLWYSPVPMAYQLMDYGEFDRLDLWRYQGAVDEVSLPLNGEAAVWHVYTATRDAQGWWSLSIDGQVQAANVVQDNRWMSFDSVGLGVASAGSLIDWVEVRAVPVPEPATLTLLGLVGLLLIIRRTRN
jgi:hypothetical protein